MRGAPQSGLAADIVWISVRTTSDGRPTHPMPAPPRPEETESAPMPRDDRFRFDDHERRPPLVPGLCQPDPEHPVDARQLQPMRMRTLKHSELMPKGEDFELQGRARAGAISKRLHKEHQNGHRSRLLIVGGNHNGCNKNRVSGNDRCFLDG